MSNILPQPLPRPELEKLLRLSAERVKAMSPGERKAMFDAQRESYVRAEMNWPKDCPYR